MDAGKPTPSTWTDLVSQLRGRAAAEPDRRAFLFVNGNDCAVLDQLSFGELDRMAGAIGDALIERGASGQPVLLQFPPGLELVAGFWGCLYAGALAVPLAVPAAHGADSAVHRVEAVVADARPACVLTTGSLEGQLDELAPRMPRTRALPRVVCGRDRTGGAGGPSPRDQQPAAARPVIRGDSIAYLQYTSGSTGDAKGVAISHRNILANSELITAASGYSPTSVLVNWAPTSHAAGLMYSVCMPVCAGFSVVHMTTQSFLEQPARWLRVISRFRATHAGGPNFGYELCLRSVTPEIWRELALDCWDNAYSSGETVRPDTLKRFAEAAAVSGFRASALQPCYGISESTLRVAQSPAGRFPNAIALETRELQRGRAREIGPAAGGEVAATELVGYGPPDQHHRTIRIVDPEQLRACPDGEIGEVWVAGPDVAAGYWNRPDASERTFRARLAGDASTYLRTGDLGVIANGELYLVGRHKELIVIRGAKHFPQDIEQDIENATRDAGITRAAAFSCDAGGDEQLVIVAEVDRGAPRDPDRTCAAIQDTVIRKHGLQIHDTVLVAPGALPRTGSGKLQRGRCRDLYLGGELPVIARVTRALAAQVDPARGAASDLRTWLRHALALRVGVAEPEISDGRPFAEYGLDSLNATKLGAELAERLGRPLPPSTLFNYPTVDALVHHLSGPAPADAAPSAVAAAARRGEPGRTPIAIIGLGCRFPGGPGLERYWHVLRHGLDAVGAVPPTRWDAAALYDPEPGAPGKTNSPAGGFIDGVDLFDRELFGLSERAAVDTDPQQRLLLELVWETLEDAGVAPAALVGSRTGVFLGISQSDYGRLTLARVHDSSPFVATGASTALAANRISYAFDLHGPSVAVDTACSSSLVAVHQACRAMEDGDCDLALAAGVSLVLTPDKTIALSQGTFLSSDGKCKPFDASADGYVRGEGAGVLLLKRLDRAQADGDRIYAVIRGTAVNQDGKTNGLTAPNGLAQQDVIRAALRDTGLGPSDIDYVEAHGTGTALGDPIEVEAIAAVLAGDGGRADALRIGSVKSNIGHLEAAAGIAGLIKVALCLHHRTLVPTLHLRQYNPHIPFAELPISVQQRTEPWIAEAPRGAGVSAFGFGGTNAHVVLQEAPEPSAGAAPVVGGDPTGSAAADRPRHLLLLSGASEAALRDLAGRYATYLGEPSAPAIADLCFTAATGRSHLAHRLAVHAQTSAELRAALAAFVDGIEPVGLISGRSAPAAVPRVAFLFTGGGAQYAGMGRELYATAPVFRAALDRCAAGLAAELDRPLLSVMFGDGDDGARLDHMAYMQPALFALEYAVTELWRSWGLEPGVVVGHSLGELAAACVAGVFSLDDGLRLIAARGRLMAALPGSGEMLAIMAGVARVEAAVRAHARELSIAAINGPENIVISGTPARIGDVMAELVAEGIKCTRLQISGASHSPLVEPMLDELEAVASRVTFHRPRIAVISNVTGAAVSADEISTPGYWRRHVRETVRFAQGVEALRAAGSTIVIEVGPRPTLLGMARAIVGDAPGVWAGSLQKGRGDWEQLLETAAAVHVHGAALDWAAFDRDRGRRKVPLPTYAFQRQRYWVGSDTGATAHGHPLLGGRIGVLGAFELDLRDLPRFIDQHHVFGKVVFPGAGFVELALAAAREHWGDAAYVIRDMSLTSALVIDDARAGSCLHVEAAPGPDDTLQIRVLSGPRPAVAGVEPVEHVRLEVRRAPGPAPAAVELEPLRARCGAEVATAAHYEILRGLGLELGAAFQGLRRMWRGDHEALAEIELEPSLADELGAYLIHPAMLDCGFQLSGAAQSSLHQLAVPVAFEQISYVARPARRVWCHARIRDQQGPSIAADVRFFDADGRVLVDIVGYVKRSVRREALISSAEHWSQWVWQPAWQPVTEARISAPSAPAAAAATGRRWLVLADPELGEALVRRLVAAGEPCTTVVPGERFAQLGEDRYAIAGSDRDDVERLLGLAADRPYSDVVCCWALAAGAALASSGWAESLSASCGAALAVAQAILARSDAGGSAARMWLVTRGAQPVTPGPVAFAESPLWGFGRVLRREHPELGGTLIDVDPQAALEAQVDGLVAGLRAPPSEASAADDEPGRREVAVRGGRRHAPRLVRYQPAAGAAERGVRSGASYLVTGGLSGLGLLTARWLVERGARALALVGRRGRTAEAEPVLQWIEGQGVQLHVAQADVASAADLSGVLRAVRAALPPLAGVFHCAGALADRALPRQTRDTFEAVCAPKIAGAWNLHTLTREDALDWFVLFSSNSAMIGLAGQANYAAANAFLDALAHDRHAAGLPALSINWGPWSEVGLAARAGMARDRLVIDPVRGLGVLQGLLGAAPSAPQAVVPTTTAPAASAPARRAAPSAASTAERGSRAGGFAERLAQVAPEDRAAAVRELVRDCVARVASKPVDDIAHDRPIIELGLDSLMTVELRNRLSAALGGRRLPSTLIMNHPTVAAIADHLGREFLGLDAAATAGAPAHPGANHGPPGNGAAPRATEARAGAAGNVVMLSGTDPAKVPLTLIHGIGGYAWAYLPLRQFVRDRSIVLVNRVPTGQGLGEYVPLLVETIRATQPRGPYILGGWSAGGRLAFEITAALERMGERVLGLFMFDVYRQTRFRRLMFATSRWMMSHRGARRALADMHPIERLLTVFGTGIDVATVEDIARLGRLVLPGTTMPSATAHAGLAEAARWFLEQLAASGGRGLMLPDATGAATEALEMLLTIRHIYRTTMGEIRIPNKIAAPGFLINVMGNEYSVGWQRHFAAPLGRFEVSMAPAKIPPRWGTPFSRFAQHIALFDPENVQRFGPEVASLLAAIDGDRPAAEPVAIPRPPHDRRAAQGPGGIYTT